jgi:hypothetical protein
MGKNSIPSWEVSEFVEYIRVRGRHDPAGAGRRVGSKAGQRRGDPAAAKRDPARVLHHHLRAAARTCAQGETLNVSVDPEFGVLPIQTVYTSSGWDSYCWTFKARHSKVWLSIHNPGHEDDPACGPLIDSIAIKTLHFPLLVPRVMFRHHILLGFKLAL